MSEEVKNTNPQPIETTASETTSPTVTDLQNHANMEVHHTHLPHGKKKFKEYFLEFLMMFLAVTLGFIAENIRENLSDRTKEKEYMESMIDDLASDTLAINTSLDFCSRIGNGTDSLSKALYTANGSDSSTQLIYLLHATYSRLIFVDFNDRTATQLRNSGNMRLIKSTEVSNALIDYWSENATIREMIDIANNTQLTDIGFSIFNRSFENDLGVDTTNFMSIVSINPHAVLMTNDKNVLINYANRMSKKAGVINGFILRHLNDQKQAAIDLIALIKEQYHFE